MFWWLLGIVLTLWIVQFGFGAEGWYVPVINAAVLLFYLIQLRKSSQQSS